MRQRRQLLPLVLLLLFIEFYAFTGLLVALNKFPPAIIWLVALVYGVLTLLLWFWVFSFQKRGKKHWSQKVYNFIRILFTCFFFGKIIVAMPMFIDDIRRGITFLILKGQNKSLTFQDIPHSVRLVWLSILVALILGTALIWGTRNKYRYKVNRVKLQFDKLPAAFKGLRIVQISDIHSGSFENNEAIVRGVDMILKEKADLILFTGDLVNNVAEEIVPYISLFSRLKAPMGVYSILGNHDYGDYISWPSDEAKQQDLEDLKQHHAAMGWQLLMNEHRIFRRGNESIALLGIENWSAKKQFPKYGRMDKAYEGLAIEDPPFKILMSHDPSHWEAEVCRDYPDIDLTLSGHTHGMQFGLRLGSKWQWSPIKYAYRQWAGLYQKEQQYLYVNVGFGFLGYPGRFGMKPEITVFDLV